MLYHEPQRDTEADAVFIQSGGLKSWGCFAFLLTILALVLLFVIVRSLLLNLTPEPVALWVTLLFLFGIVTGAFFLWKRRRRRLLNKQEQMWQVAMGNDSPKL